jgi:ADP-ribosylglycohydrolase family protein
VSYSFNETCQGTVPQALICFLESHDFESALRLAVSIGGDSDTLAAITGGIAEAYYGIPKDIENQALTYLPEEFQQVIWEFREKIKNNKKKLPL